MKLLRLGIVVFVALRIWIVFWSLRATLSGTHSHFKDQPVVYKVKRRKHEPPSVTIGIAVPDRVRFRLRPESMFDALGKVLSIAREWQTEDPLFDESVYIICDDPTTLAQFSDNTAFRKAAFECMRNSGGGTLCCSHGKLFIEVKSLHENRNDDLLKEAACSKVLPALNCLRDHITALSNETWESSRDPDERVRLILTTLTLMLGAAGLVEFFSEPGLHPPRPVVFHQTEILALAITVLVSALLHLMLFAMMRSGSRTHLAWLDVLLIGIPGTWIVAHAEAAKLNLDDSSTGAEHYVEVVGQHATRFRRSTTYYLHIQGWPDPRAEKELDVSESVYRSIDAGECVRVVWHEGRLGDGWISTFEPTGKECREAS